MNELPVKHAGNRYQHALQVMTNSTEKNSFTVLTVLIGRQKAGHLACNNTFINHTIKQVHCTEPGSSYTYKKLN